MKKKYKILLIGYSNIAKKRYINNFIKNDIPFCVASRSFKKKIEGSYQQFDNYDKALKYSGADIVYLSLPNLMHFHWSKKVLNSGFHLIVDKPITTKIGELNQLIKIAKRKQLLLTEATFFNYHQQFELIKKYNSHYYDKDNPIISDQEYDQLKKEIIELEAKNNFLKSKKSPSNSVGFKPSKNFKKVKHKVPMLSLGNVFNEEDLKNFEKKILNFLSFKNSENI